MKRFLITIILFVFAFSSSLALAVDKVVVIPLNSVKQLKNVVTVSAHGGNFTDPVAAVNSITDASTSNRYLVVIGPGEYTITQTLVMKPHVDIIGSGKDTTKLRGSISSNSIGTSSAIVVGSAYTSMSDLEIWNTGGGGYSIGIYNSGAAYEIDRLNISAWGGSSGNYGMYNINNSNPRITDSHVHGSTNGTNTAGTLAYGLYNDGSSPTLNRVYLSASEDETYGGNSFGINSVNSSHPKIRYSYLYGNDYGLQQTGGSVHVSYSTITSPSGYPIDTGGTPDVRCVYNDNDRGDLLDSTCHLIGPPTPL